MFEPQRKKGSITVQVYIKTNGIVMFEPQRKKGLYENTA